MKKHTLYLVISDKAGDAGKLFKTSKEADKEVKRFFDEEMSNWLESNPNKGIEDYFYASLSPEIIHTKIVYSLFLDGELILHNDDCWIPNLGWTVIRRALASSPLTKWQPKKGQK